MQLNFMEFKFFIMTASKFKKWKISSPSCFHICTNCRVEKFHGESRVQWKSYQKVNMMLACSWRFLYFAPLSTI